MKKLFTLFVCLGAGAMVWAQTLKVTGTVVDEDNGEPLIGVSVLEKGTTNGIITDLDGNFSLNVAENAILQFSYVGYATEEMKAKKNFGTIEMKGEAVALTDVLVTGQLAKQQKTPVAVSQVTALEIEERLGGQEFPEVGQFNLDRFPTGRDKQGRIPLFSRRGRLRTQTNSNRSGRTRT